MPDEPVETQPLWMAAEHDVAEPGPVKGWPDHVDGIARGEFGSHARSRHPETDVWKGPKHVTKSRLGKGVRHLEQVVLRLPPVARRCHTHKYLSLYEGAPPRR